MEPKEITKHVDKLVTIKIYDDNPPRERSSATIFGHLLAVEPARDDDTAIKVLLNDCQLGRDIQVILLEDRFSIEPGERVVITEAALADVDRRLKIADQQMRDAVSAVDVLTGQIARLKGNLPPNNGLGNAKKLLQQVTTLEAERSLKAKKYKDLVGQHANLKYLRNRIWIGLIKSARQRYQQACRAELDQYLDRLQPIIASADTLASQAGAVTDGAAVAQKVCKVKRHIEEAISAIKAL